MFPIYILFMNISLCLFLIWFNMSTLINSDFILFYLFLVELMTLMILTWMGLFMLLYSMYSHSLGYDL